MDNRNLPLTGIRVVELGTHVAIPTAARCMADWGATVIKIENIHGDEWRVIGKGYNTTCTDDENPIFTMQNANKKFISLDLKSEEGLAVLMKLLETADVFASNVRLKSLKRMGIDYDSIKDRFPRLIYTHFTGFGYNGPDAERPGFDKTAFWARSGADVDMSYAGGYPVNPLLGFGDATVANALLSGILAALLGREKTGRGIFLSSSLYGCAIWYSGIGIISSQEIYKANFPKDYMEPALPFSHIYKCKDGEWIIITVIDHDSKYEKMCRALCMEEYLDDERYKYIENVKKHKKEFVNIVSDHFMQKTCDEWMTIFNEYDIVCERLTHFYNVIEDQQAWENGFLERIPFASGRDVIMPANPVRFIGYDAPDCRTTGKVGCDTAEVLGSIGYSSQQIDAMKKNGIVSAD